MRSWFELHYLGRQKVADAVHRAEEARRAGQGQDGNRRRPATLLLSRGEVLSVRVARSGLRVTCITGRAWTTTDRSGTDTVLLPGQSAEYRDRGKVVIEALRTAAVRIECREAIRMSVGTTLRPALVSF